MNVELACITLITSDEITAAGFNGTILRTTNAGSNWIQQFSGTTSDLRGIYYPQSNLGFAVGYEGTIIKTTNSGISWSPLSSGITINLFAVFFYNEMSGTAVGTGKIIRTTDGGNSWVNQPIPFTGDLYDITFANLNSGWAVGQSGRTFYTNNGGVGVKQISSELPESFALNQNYPNPFNPTTNLEFKISKFPKGQAGFVSLKIYNLLGQEIAVLINSDLNPGTYKYEFDASDLKSGVYFYKLWVSTPSGETGNFKETKKMTLIK